MAGETPLPYAFLRLLVEGLLGVFYARVDVLGAASAVLVLLGALG